MSKSLYRKSEASGASDRGEYSFDDGWAIIRQLDGLDGEEELVAVVDTETLADTFIAALDAANRPTADTTKDPTSQKRTVWFLWGGEASQRYQEDGTINFDDLREYSFDTEAEINAFLEGVEAAEGWTGYEQFDTDPRIDTQIAEPDPSLWPPESQLAATLQGWDVFYCNGSDDGLWQLQAIAAPGDHPHLGYTEPKFTDEHGQVSDQAAAKFVQNMADAGDELAIRAIKFLIHAKSRDVAKFGLHLPDTELP